MPKIHRIRIVGLKYDGMQKQYKDTTFDFHNDQTSTNGLIAMMNGGGKGVFLQTIFQILKPGTAWGKQNNRYYQQFFFNKKEQFVPYTFHVLIEWQLDGADNRHLVTGGMFSAEQRFSLQEETGKENESNEREAKINPNITFYTREFDRKEDVALEHIPLFEDGEVADSEELKDYFKWNGYDVYKDSKKHYRLLETYGINRKDWDIMKDINKDEGGVGKYFEGAEDDHSLFKKRIIPTVSQVLQRSEHQKNDLVDIFKSQASIAKDLPILLKREQAHLEFLEDIVPFEDQIRVALLHKEIETASTKDGQQLLGALEHVIAIKKDELTTLSADIEKLIDKSIQLRFEKDNLEYAKAHREMLEWEKKIVVEKEKHEDLKGKVEEKNEEKEKFSLALLLKEWSEMEQTIVLLSSQIEKLEQNSGLEQVNERMEEIKKEAKNQWDDIAPVLQSEVNQYVGYKKYTEKQKKELTASDKQKMTRLVQVETEIKSLAEGIHDFETKEEELIRSFGERVKYDLQSFIESVAQKQLAYEKEATLLKEEEKGLQAKQNELSHKRGTHLTNIQNLEEKTLKLRDEYELQQKKEEELFEQLRVMLDDVVMPLTHAKLSKYTTEIEEYISATVSENEELKKALWEKQQDYEINDESYWIANKDVKELKEWIDVKTGIDVFYGTQYLHSLPTIERNELLANEPLLPYGLVVSQLQWEKINQQVLTGKMYKSPVPIFMREEMNNGAKDTSFVLVNGKEHNLFTNKQAFSDWKIAIGKEIEEQKAAIEELDKTEQSYRRMLKTIDRLVSQPMCMDVKKALDETEEELSKVQSELKEAEQNVEKLKEKQIILSNKIEETIKIFEKCKKDIEVLLVFEQEKELYVENKRVKEEKEKQKTIIFTEQQEIEKELSTLQLMIAQWNETYVEWKLTIDQQLREIARFVTDARFPSVGNAESTEEPPNLSLHILDSIKSSLEELKLLQKSKEEQANELLAIQAKKDAEHSQQLKLEKKLRALNKEWKECDIPTEPLPILEELKQAAEKDAKQVAKEEREQGTKVTIAETSLEHTKEQRAKAEKKVQKHEKEAEAWEELDLDEKEAEIKDSTKETKSTLKKAEKQQKETEQSIASYENDQLTLSMILKEEAAPFTSEHLEKVESLGKKCILDWCESYEKIKEDAQTKHKRLEQTLRNLKTLIESKDWEIRFKNEVLTSLDHLDTRHYEHMETVVKNMKRFSRSGLEQLDHDKERAEKAQNFWASRASMKVISIADGIRSMIAKMKIKNERGSFPLVQLKDDILPKKAEDVEPLLKQHFVTAIDKITSQFQVIDDANKALDDEIRELIGDEQILFVALRNRYPELLVYNMRTDNAFMYGKPQKEHYSTWQTINQGSRTKSDGSGGQKLSARMVMMMMLLSVKSEANDAWVSLICDNPFGQAASAHVLDPIFAVAEKLKFQLIIVTPPELVKTEISQRFDAYYKLDFIRENGKEIVTDTVVPAFRIYQGEEVETG